MSVRISDLRARSDGLMPADRRHFQRRISGAAKISSRQKRDKVLATLEREIDAAARKLEARRLATPDKISYPAELPITDRRQELLDAIRDNQVVIVAGETGSGKSTQLPKLCLELGRGVAGWIGHTQPRRIAARSIASRVAEELGGAVGGIVGYTVRFSDQVGDTTLVKLMTDGILLNEIHHDRRLSRYDTIIVDEAHERSLNIDFLLGYLKELLPRRPDLKVIITSATIDTERFSAHFNDAPIVEVSGRTYPVEMRYRPLDDPTHPEPRDQPQGICDAVVELFTEKDGDILVFCSGEREIRDAADAINELGLRHTEIVPLYGRLSTGEQNRVFAKHTGRRVVVATNVAETSLTVPGIRAVVDAGTARISRYGRRTKVQRLPIEPISRASADQRAGRCGRLGPGVCIRLYSEDDYNSRPEFTEPEIQRTSLASVILQMAALDLGDIETFPFLDPPDSRSIRDGVALLEEVGALRRNGDESETRRRLTKLGRQLARIPLDIRLARMILEADHNDCLREVEVIAAALSIQDPRERPIDKEQQADQMHARFRHEESDFLGWLQLWDYLRNERRARTSGQFRRLCRDEYLSYRRVREWQDIHAQLRDISDELKLHRNRRKADGDTVHRTLLAGLLSHVGKKNPDGYEYRGARGARFYISPGSTLFKRSPEWVMAAELVETTRLWAHSVVGIPPEWIEQAGAHLIRRSHSDPWWDAERGSAVARESVSLYGIPLQTDRVVQYGRFDPAAARELFIRHALVAGEWQSHHDFVAHNHDQIDTVLEMEARERRTNLLIDDDTLTAWFAARIPEDITTVRHFDRWWRDMKGRQPHRLDLTLDDLIDPASAAPDASAFPQVWEYGDLGLPLEYEFDPASPADGVTIDVPLRGLDRIDPTVFEWHVPGLRHELVTELIRSMPKSFRKLFAPVPDTARQVLARITPQDGGLLLNLRRELQRIGGVPIPADVFDLSALPPHLRPAFRVIDDEGREVADGSDLHALKQQVQEETRSAVDTSAHEIEATGLTEWGFGELPSVVEISGTEHTMQAFPALIDEGETVGVALLATADEQDAAMWQGTIRLLLLNLPSPGKLLRPLLDPDAKEALRTGPHADQTAWVQDCLGCALGEIITAAGGPAWDGVAFDRLLRTARDELHPLVTRVAQDSLDLFVALEEAESAFNRLDDTRHAEVLQDIGNQVASLIYPGFLTQVGSDRIADIRRYLLAITKRIERLAQDPQRDSANMAIVHELEDELDRISAALPGEPRLMDAAWMIQELRVSLFAQSVGTKGKVSAVRIRRLLDEIEMG
ncbi:MAG: ATP-dependent RNA helicase HrpA [Acidimicrobiia bacterium]|nr:ATP-dependent RNA helicase HrpA [Acidimicrobiia bacterium]